MKEVVEDLINKINRDDLQLLFGHGSYVKIADFKYSTNLKKHYVYAIVNATETNDDIYQLVYPTGLEMLVDEAMKYIGISNAAITTSLNII